MIGFGAEGKNDSGLRKSGIGVLVAGGAACIKFEAGSSGNGGKVAGEYSGTALVYSGVG